jgi:hypothetical protein
MMDAASGTVGDHENLARFVLSESWLYKNGRAGTLLRPNAWIPHPLIKLSVFRVSDWMEEQIAEQGCMVAAEREANHRIKTIAAGKDYPAGKTTFRYHGRGEILASQVRSAGLEVVPDEPPPMHADIVNWPPLTGNRKHDESSQLAFALKLQAHARFVDARHGDSKGRLGRSLQ